MKHLFKSLLLSIIIAGSVMHAADKRKLLWFDATANFERFSYNDSIRYYLDKTKQAGFTDVVVDVKPITGEVLYPSSIAPEMKEWNKFQRKNHSEFLRVFIEESHKRGLRIHASLNTFVAGHNYIDRGPVYGSKSAWQSINYTDSGMVPISRLKHKYSAMTNPANKEIQMYEISILEELVRNYDLDGIILDRVRYDCIEGDFSELSKQLFENASGLRLDHFPQDIFEWKKDSTGKPFIFKGKYYKQWLEWRTSVIYNYIRDARMAVKKIKPQIVFGDYTGAWYPTYYELGVNWASNKYDPSAEYDWATPDYKNYGYAELLDLYTTGCYFYEVTKKEVEELNEREMKKAMATRTEAAMGKGKEYWYSVEGSAELAMNVTKGAVPVYGGLYVEQYDGHPEQFKKAVQMCLEKTDGLMVFDIIHIINKNWWHLF